MFQILIFIISLGARAVRTMCRRRADLVLENLALRQQVTALKKERPRPPLGDIDRAFWAALRQSWPLWASRLAIVKADTVARWHRDRFRQYWAKISRRRRPGRPRVDTEIRHLIRSMAQDGWGAPRIHAELMKLGFDVSEITVSLVNTRQPVKSRTYNLLEFRAEEGETPPTCSVYSSSSSPSEPVHCGRCVGAEPTL